MTNETGKPLSACVVIPTYHRLDLLTRALESINAQDRTVDEINIAVADPAELNEVNALIWKLGLNNTRAVSNGLRLLGGAARNLGWMTSNCDIIFFLDDDDYFHPKKIGEHLAQHSLSGSDVVYSGVIYAFDDGKCTEYKASSVPANLIEAIETGFCLPTTSCASVRRAYLAKVGGFDNTLPSYQDWDLWYRLASVGAIFSNVHMPLTYFVQHQNERVSMNANHRSDAIKLILTKYDYKPNLQRFFDEEYRHTLERIFVYGARNHDWRQFGNFARSVKKREFGLLEKRTYWILFKMLTYAFLGPILAKWSRVRAA